MKKILYIGVILLLSVSIIFADNSPSPWAQEEVNTAKNKHLVIPEVDGNFQSDISREVFCKLIVNMVEKSTNKVIMTTTPNPFEDVNSLAVTKAYQMGIVKGTSATTFHPNKNITRQEIAAMMMRSARLLDTMKGYTLTQNIDISGITFADKEDISAWAMTDVKELYKLGLMKGVGNNMIAPLEPTTIEQSILLSLRLYKKFEASIIKPEVVQPLPGFTLLFEANEGQSIEIPLNSLYSNTGSAIITDVTAPSGAQKIIIKNDKKAIIYNAEYLDETITHSMSAKIKDGSTIKDVNFKIKVKNVPGVKAKNNLMFDVYEGETIIIPMEDIYDGQSDNATIIGAGGGVSGQLEITNGKKAIKYTGEDVSKNTTHEISTTLSDGSNVKAKLNLLVREVGNKAPEKAYSGIFLNVVLPPGSNHTTVLFEDIAKDEDTDDKLKIVKIVPQNKPNPKNISCKQGIKFIKYPGLPPIPVGYCLDVSVDGTGNPGTDDDLGFYITFTDGTDEVVTRVRVEKQW